eukprot:456402-Prorocentrum_minimum.AAC.2
MCTRPAWTTTVRIFIILGFVERRTPCSGKQVLQILSRRYPPQVRKEASPFDLTPPSYCFTGVSGRPAKPANAKVSPLPTSAWVLDRQIRSVNTRALRTRQLLLLLVLLTDHAATPLVRATPLETLVSQFAISKRGFDLLETLIIRAPGFAVLGFRTGFGGACVTSQPFPFPTGR